MPGSIGPRAGRCRFAAVRKEKSRSMSSTLIRLSPGFVITQSCMFLRIRSRHRAEFNAQTPPLTHTGRVYAYLFTQLTAVSFASASFICLCLPLFSFHNGLGKRVVNEFAELNSRLQFTVDVNNILQTCECLLRHDRVSHP